MKLALVLLLSGCGTIAGETFVDALSFGVPVLRREGRQREGSEGGALQIGASSPTPIELRPGMALTLQISVVGGTPDVAFLGFGTDAHFELRINAQNFSGGVLRVPLVLSATLDLAEPIGVPCIHNVARDGDLEPSAQRYRPINVCTRDGRCTPTARTGSE